jgi:hypothetical protein
LARARIDAARAGKGDGVMELAVAVFMVAMAVGIAGTWTVDIARRSPDVDWAGGVLRARTAADGVPLLPHWVAEYGTAIALAVGAAGLLAGASWAAPVAFAALGALLYTSTNSLGWAIARRERRPYALPMLLGAAGGLLAIAALLAR